MRGGPRRLPLIAHCALGALIALILAGTYIYRESGPSPAAGVLVDTGGSVGGGDEVFTVDGDWDLRWSNDCSPSFRNLFQLVDWHSEKTLCLPTLGNPQQCRFVATVQLVHR